MALRSAMDAVVAFTGSARVASAIATSAIGAAVLAWPLQRLIGLPGLNTIIITLCLLAVASVWARRDSIDGTGLLPISLLGFGGWAMLSIFWSSYQWATLAGLLALAGFTILGLYVSLVRDTIQIVRAFGDVARLVLVVSLVVEVLSGLLIDTPIPFLGIGGNLAVGGPISGVIGNRNDLGLIAIIGAISFVIELRTKSLQRWPAIGSLILASLVLVLTRSPIAWGTALVVVAAAAVLYALRRTSAQHRRGWQFGTLGAAAAVALGAWWLRSPIVDALNATGELNYRLDLWRDLWDLLQVHFVEGWGWIGQWNTGISPYLVFATGNDRLTVSASNAYLDVWFQLGIVGLALFLVLVGLAFVRSWLLASRKRSVVYTWPALALAALLTASLAESSILIDFGWMTFVICCVKASQSLGWRTAFQKPLEPETLN